MVGAAIILKADGRSEPFSATKLEQSLIDAGAKKALAASIVTSIEKRVYDRVPSSEIRNWVIDALMDTGSGAAERFLYKKRRVSVVGGHKSYAMKDSFEHFNKQRIISSLMKETGMEDGLARSIAKKAESFLLDNNITDISGGLIREIVNHVLLQEGHDAYYRAYRKIGLPVYEISQLIDSGSHENANQQYNPETIHKLIADNIFRMHALANVLPKELSDAHKAGAIHIHDLDYFSTRPFCFSHDLRFFLKNGLKADGLGVHTSVAGPAKNATVAILHAAKVLACGQVNCAGGQGFNWFNIILAPYLRGMSERQVKQLAQMFIYEMSMMYVSRGGQVVFSSIDVEPGIPKTLADIPAVQPGGKVREGATYADYHDESNRFFNALTDVYLEGDHVGKPFNFPKYELKLHHSDFKRYPDEMRKVSELAAKFGTPYYFIQQDYLPEYACYQCCSFLMPLSKQNTETDLYNGTVRGGAMQVVCINLPQLAYEAKGDDAALWELLQERMEKARQVMEIKKAIIKRNLKHGMLPFMSQPIDDEMTPYYDPETQGYEIGMVGLNEMLKSHLGEELHESSAAWKFGLRAIKQMNDHAKTLGEESDLMLGISRVPAESAAYRLARIDAQRYRNAIVQGERKTDSIYYTNSTHIRPSADISLIEKLKIEGSFHPLLDGGAMSHVWLGEGDPDPDAMTKLTERIAKNTLQSYFAYNRDLTVCNTCLHTVAGVLRQCPKCGSKDMDWLSRITGYYQRVSIWNAGKKAEFFERQRYRI